MPNPSSSFHLFNRNIACALPFHIVNWFSSWKDRSVILVFKNLWWFVRLPQNKGRMHREIDNTFAHRYIHCSSWNCTAVGRLSFFPWFVAACKVNGVCALRPLRCADLFPPDAFLFRHFIIWSFEPDTQPRIFALSHILQSKTVQSSALWAFVALACHRDVLFDELIMSRDQTKRSLNNSAEDANTENSYPHDSGAVKPGTNDVALWEGENKRNFRVHSRRSCFITSPPRPLRRARFALHSGWVFCQFCFRSVTTIGSAAKWAVKSWSRIMSESAENNEAPPGKRL